MARPRASSQERTYPETKSSTATRSSRRDIAMQSTMPGVKPQGVLLGAQVVEGSSLDFSEVARGATAVQPSAVEPVVFRIPTLLYGALDRGK
jgi:hypothetical protein